MRYYICYASFIHFEGFSKLYISIHHEFAPGMYNYHFFNDFVINSSQFDFYEDLTYGFLATGWNRNLILHPVPHPALRSTRDLAQYLTLHSTCDTTLRENWSWQLVHWWPLMDESWIWVLFPLVPSNYGARHISDWVVATTVEWHTKTVKKDVVVRINLMNLLFLERVYPSSGRSLNLYNNL